MTGSTAISGSCARSHSTTRGSGAALVMWVANSYYSRGAPRYPLESAAIALVGIGVVVVLLRRGGTTDTQGREPISIAALPVFIVAALALYAPALQLGLLSDDFVLRAAARTGSVSLATGFFRPLPLLVWRGLFVLTES